MAEGAIFLRERAADPLGQVGRLEGLHLGEFEQRGDGLAFAPLEPLERLLVQDVVDLVDDPEAGIHVGGQEGLDGEEGGEPGVAGTEPAAEELVDLTHLRFRMTEDDGGGRALPRAERGAILDALGGLAALELAEVILEANLA